MKPELTKEDWAEIYYALLSKLSKVENGDYEDFDNKGTEFETKWIEHLNSIIDKIGPDGENMYN